MSLDQFHHFIGLAQFLGLIGPAPGVRDTRFHNRSIDSNMYKDASGVHVKPLKVASRDVKAFQGLIKETGTDVPNPPNRLIGTGVIYDIVYKAVGRLQNGYIPPGTDRLASAYEEITVLTQEVVGGVMPPVATDALTMSTSTPDASAILFKAMSEMFLQLYAQAAAKHRERKQEFDKTGNCPTVVYETSGEVSLCSLGSLVIVKWGEKTWITTAEHFRLVPDQLLHFRNLCIMMKDMVLRGDSPHFSIIDLICRLGLRDQSHVGAAFRVLRAYVMAMGVDRTTALTKVMKETLESFDGTKREFGQEVIDLATSITDSYTELSQLGNCYKFVIPPDISMKDCFEAAFGTKEPNKVKDAASRNFRGLLRKRVYLMLLSDGHPVHAESPDEKFNDELGRPSPSSAKLEKVPLIKWADVEFKGLKSMKDYKSVKLRTNDKSSANEMPSAPQVEISSYNPDWLMGKESVSKAPVGQTKSNDVLANLSQGETLDPRKGYKRFKGLVKSHKRLEKKLMKKLGIKDYKDIPSENLAAEILKDPELFYTVNTEPKDGEYHKPAGRLFYMATREMKAFISAVERLCRTVFHGQVGNSIVSSYMRREAQLRAMAKSTSFKNEDMMLYFVSFDMSEFSKKFPMELVNEIGSVFAELTGDLDLARLDVIFRAGIVVHSTRGFEGLFAGVRGGFEGFLNFVWTAAHVTIMELALLNTQKQGLVMAYSDDGLLEFVVPASATREEKLSIVRTVQNTYANLGLTFHLYKTLVATNTFEYLGLVAKDGRFIDGWGKALSNLGIKQRRAAFTPFMDQIDTLVGQCNAVVEALCPVDMVYYHMLLDIYLLVQRKTSRLTCSQIVLLARMPRSLGGLGVPSQLAMSITSERPSIEDFIHTALLKIDSGSDDITVILNALVDNKPEAAALEMGYMQGDYYTSQIPKIDPSPILANLAEEAAAKASMKEVPNPITASRAKQLITVTKVFKNLPLALFALLVASSPLVQAYQSRLGVATSRGAFTYLGRTSIRQAQLRDTRQVNRVLAFWSQRFRETPARSSAQAVKQFVRLVNGSARRAGFAPLRLKPETLLLVSRSPDGALASSFMSKSNAELLNNPKRVRKLDDSIYAAPDMTSGLPDRTPRFDTSERLDKNLPDRMVKAIGKLLTVCPEGLDAVLTITGLLGARVPSIPTSLKSDLSRVRAIIRGKPSLVVKMPQTAFALTVITPLKPLNDAAASGQVTDYSSHILTMKVISGMFAYRIGDLRGRPSSTPRKLWYRLIEKGDVGAMCYEPETEVISKVPESYLSSYMPGSARDESQSLGLTNLMAEMRERASIISIESGSVEIRSHIATALSLQLARRINLKLHKLPTSIILDKHAETEDERVNSEIKRLTYLEVARMNLSRCQDHIGPDDIREYLERLDELSLELPVFMNEPSFRGLLLDGTLESYIASTQIASLAAVGNQKATLLGDLNNVSVYRKALSLSIRDMYHNLFSEDHPWKWKGRLTIGPSGGPVLVQSRGVGFTMDDVLDGLTAMQEALRTSNHRSRPYNTKTFVILFTKLRIISASKSCMLSGQERNSVWGHMSKSQLSPQVAEELKLHFIQELGPDHRALVESPLGDRLSNRATIYAKSDNPFLRRRLKRYRGMGSTGEAIDTGRALQTFLHNCMSQYLTRHTVQLSSNTLRSSEVSNVLTGRWKQKSLSLATAGAVPPSEYLSSNQAAGLLAGQMIILRNHTAYSEDPLRITLPISSEPLISLRACNTLGKHGIAVNYAGDDDVDTSSIEFSPYPGEDNQVLGSYYTMVQYSETASQLVSTLSRISSLAETVGDIVEHDSGYLLSCALLAMSNAPEGHEDASDSGSGSSSVSQLSHLAESDARQVVSSTLHVASIRRLSEAGVHLTEVDPLDVTNPLPLASTTGVGASRRGGWEGRVIPNEPGLASAVVLCHVLSTPRNAVRGAALGWASLKLPADAPYEVIASLARKMIRIWTEAIRKADPFSGPFVRQGVYSEISSLVTWLRAQGFRSPIEDPLPDALILYDAPSTSMLEDSMDLLVLNRFTNTVFDTALLREHAANEDGFLSLGRTMAPEPPGVQIGSIARPEGMSLQLLRAPLEEIEELSLGSDGDT